MVENGKKEKLNALLKEYIESGLLIALSGGVDSTLLLAVTAKLTESENSDRVVAVTFHTPLHSESEVETAKAVADSFGVNHHVLEIATNFPHEILYNEKLRCYACKKHLFLNAIDFARTLGFQNLIDGTNADDLKVYRPGKRALDELGVKSPLAVCGFTKAEIREYAEQLGLATAQRPSMPCLATRIPYNTKLDFDVLKKINRGENILRQMGFEVLRLRFHEPILRIEIEKSAFYNFIKMSDEITAVLKEIGFKYITLDLEGFRSGSFDV